MMLASMLSPARGRDSCLPNLQGSVELEHSERPESPRIVEIVAPQTSDADMMSACEGCEDDGQSQDVAASSSRTGDDATRAGEADASRGVTKAKVVSNLRKTRPTTPIVCKFDCSTCMQRAQHEQGTIIFMHHQRGSNCNVLANTFGPKVEPNAGGAAEAAQLADGVPWASVVSSLSNQDRIHVSSEDQQRIDQKVRERLHELAMCAYQGEKLWLACACVCPCMSESSRLRHACHAGVYAEQIFAIACGHVLRVPIHRDEPIVRALATGRRVVVILFAGEKGALAAAVDRRGSAGAAYEVKLDGVHQNLDSPSVIAVLEAAGKAGWIRALIDETPCCSFTCLRHLPRRAGKQAAPPLRLKSLLPDFPEPPLEWKAYFDKHERFVAFVFGKGRLADRVLAWPGGRLISEHPVRRSDKALKRFYREQFAEHVSLDMHPVVRAFMHRQRAREVIHCQCMMNSPFQKGTSLIADAATASDVSALERIDCLHPPRAHRKEAYGEDEDGESLSAEAAEYSEEYEELLAAAATGAGADECSRIIMQTAERVINEQGLTPPAGGLSSTVRPLAASEEASASGQPSKRARCVRFAPDCLASDPPAARLRSPSLSRGEASAELK